MPWVTRKLRGNRVFVRVDGSGEPITDRKNLAQVVYKLEPGAKIYRASVRNLEATGEPSDTKAVELEPHEEPDAGSQSGPIPDDAIIIYTDGACTGNPGPAGIGAVIIDGQARQELSEYLGMGTNNIAELTAIERALQEVPAALRERPVVVHSDSSYSIGLLTKNWKAKANAELVARLRSLAREFPKLRFVKVKGHAGIPDNERCDQLARDAITNRA